MRKHIHLLAITAAFVISAALVSCTDETNYDQRTVVYVSSINDGAPFLCDVLNQGDSLYEPDQRTYKTSDDFITEDYIVVEFYNKPYSSVLDPENSSLGDFLVTDYDVSFTPLGAASLPVQPFSGKTSVLVPSGEKVTGAILLVPYAAKQVSPLVDLMYSPNEIMAFARIVFHGHEVQTNRTVSFETGISVNFADPLLTKNDQR